MGCSSDDAVAATGREADAFRDCRDRNPHSRIPDLRTMQGGGFEPPKAEPAGLQPAPFGHSGIPAGRAIVAAVVSATYDRGVERFDVLVVGAGPAGSATALHLARSGARVLLVDKARFPRDKPCGGGLTGRALRHAPTDVEPVVEHVVVAHGHAGRIRLERGAGELGAADRDDPTPPARSAPRRAGGSCGGRLPERRRCQRDRARRGRHGRFHRWVARDGVVRRRRRWRKRCRRTRSGSRRRNRARGRARGECAVDCPRPGSLRRDGLGRARSRARWLWLGVPEG